MVFAVFCGDVKNTALNRSERRTLASYAGFLGKASGMDLDGYSVSLPNVYVDQGTPVEMVRAASWPDPVLLGLLNAKYLVSSFPLLSERLRLVKTFGKTQVFENMAVQPRAWIKAPWLRFAFTRRIEKENFIPVFRAAWRW
jgi:hypothetical protein